MQYPCACILYCIIPLYTPQICFHSEQRHLHNVTFVMFLFLEYLFIMKVLVCCIHTAGHLICLCDMVSIYSHFGDFTFWRFYISEILHFGDFKHETHRQQRSAADCSVCPYIYTTHCCRHQAYRRNSFVYDRKCHLSGAFRHQCIHSNQIRQNGHTRRNIFSSVRDIDMPLSHLRFFFLSRCTFLYLW